MVWWHDSWFERSIFDNPNPVIEKYLKYLPGTDIDGIAFINKSQIELGKRWFSTYNAPRLESFFRQRAVVIPNTSDITWEWEHKPWESDQLIHPPVDNYNNSFFDDVGLKEELSKRNMTMQDAVILLQHTRVVPRKRIETAIDMAFELEKKYLNHGIKKCVTVLVSGHSGDEQFEYKKYLKIYFKEKLENHPHSNVVLIFGESHILSHRDIIVDKKYYKFAEIPAIVASVGGVGTFFSEVEGFGNNLLEMISFGLPVTINRYKVYKEEIEHLGFRLPAINNDELTDAVVEETFRLLTDIGYRNQLLLHNLKVLNEKLGHAIISDKLKPLIINMFTRLLK
jgi:glycosyltransferase involved in cell wall biosynthesis